MASNIEADEFTVPDNKGGDQVGARSRGCDVSSDNTDGTETQSEETQAPVQEKHEFSTKTWREDLTLVIEGNQLYVSSSILALVSPVFSSMFDTTFQGDCQRVLELPGNYVEFVEFLQCVYPSIKKQVTTENVLLVTPLAKTYEIDNVLKAGEKVLNGMCDEERSLETLCSVLKLSEVCDMAKLKQVCVEILASRDDLDLREDIANLQLSQEHREAIDKARHEAVEQRIKHLEKRLEEKTRECDFYKTITRNTWLEDQGLSTSEGLVLNMMHLTYSRRDPTAYVAIRVKHMTWTLKCDIRKATVSYNGEESLHVFLSARGPPDWNHWSCPVTACFRVTDGNRVWWEQTTPPSSSSTTSYNSFHSRDRQNKSGKLRSGDNTVEIEFRMYKMYSDRGKVIEKVIDNLDISVVFVVGNIVL